MIDIKVSFLKFYSQILSSSCYIPLQCEIKINERYVVLNLSNILKKQQFDINFINILSVQVILNDEHELYR